MHHLLSKLEKIRNSPSADTFILADARDPDMAWGVASFGPRATLSADKDIAQSRFRSKPEFLDEIRAVVKQGLIDVMLTSVSTMEILAHRDKLFDSSHVTPAVRVNDATDIWCPRGGRYRDFPSIPFATPFFEEIQFGSLTAPRAGSPVVNLGLYSVTFNNDLESDLRNLTAFREFRGQCERIGFRYFLEIFAPNSPKTGLNADQIPDFVNDHIARMLAGVPSGGRPLFLKMPYFGPRPLAELVSHDPTLIVGVLGGSSGTTMDAFQLLAEAKKYGARVALFGRKIKESEHPLSFIELLRRVADGEVTAPDAVRGYHNELTKLKIRPKQPLDKDLQLTSTAQNY